MYPKAIAPLQRAQYKLRFPLIALVLALISLAFLISTTAQAAPAPLQADTQVFEALLTGPAEPNHPDTVATGRAVFALSADETTLFYHLSVSDIISVTASHIHIGAPGVAGPVVINLLNGAPLAPDTPVSGSATVTPTQVAELKAGNYYVNVHTVANPAGEIRGQIGAYTPAVSYHALLLGANEAPTPVDTAARGLARFELSGATTLSYTVYVTDITGVTASHIHLGAAGVAGPVVYPLFTGGGSFGNNAPISGTIALDAEQLVNLLTGNHYVNVHTTANAPGEIRGQIVSASTFWAALSGAQETPPVESAATGKAILALNGAADALAYRVMVSNIVSVTASHIHKAPAGVAGPVVFPLFTGGGSFDANRPVSGTLALDWAQVLDLIGDDYYVNVHTSAHAPGEIRGQIGAYAPPVHHVALLRGDHEVPPNEAPGAGLGRVVLNASQGLINYTLAVTDITGISASHIHKAPTGVSGPVVVGLYSGVGPFDGDNPIGGGAHLTAANLVDMLTGYYYINVHTPTNPGGELRGQIGNAGLFQAALSGDQEAPPVSSNASGKAVLALNDMANELVYRVRVSNIMSVTASHIHLGAAGVSGGVLFPLFTGGGSFDPTHPISGSLSLNTSQVLDLVQDEYYINVHTAITPSGEIRGQVLAYAPNSNLAVDLAGANEVPAMSSNASGAAALHLDALSGQLSYSVILRDISDVTASHIHKGVAGVSGPVVFPLFTGAGSFGPGSPIGGCLALNAQYLVDLLTDYYYINVHTSAHPTGEIRGQIDAAFTDAPTYLPVIFTE
ncbi:MAG: CHRD domain-containing protein [Caldilineaceae bacterium]